MNSSVCPLFVSRLKPLAQNREYTARNDGAIEMAEQAVEKEADGEPTHGNQPQGTDGSDSQTESPCSLHNVINSVGEFLASAFSNRDVELEDLRKKLKATKEKNEELHGDLEQVLFSKVIDAAEIRKRSDEKSEKEKSQLREEFTKKIDEETRRLKNEINCAHEERLRVCETYNKMLADLKREHQEEIAELKRYHMEIVKGHYNKLADMHSEMLDIQEQYQKRIDDFIEAYRDGQADRASENLEKFKRIADCVNSLAFRFKSELDLRDEEIARTLAKRDSLDERSATVDDIVITRTFILGSSSMEEDLEPGLTIEEVFDEDSNEFEEGEDN